MQKIPEPLRMPQWLKTLHAYVQCACPHTATVREMLADDKWPCHVCLGRGWDYDPADKPCPVEGNKMRGRIKCPDCGGSGYGERDWWEQQWQLARAERAARINAFESVRAVMRQALDKLTAEEAAALGWQKPDPTILETVVAIRKVGDNE